MYAVIAESDKTGDIYVFKCDHDPDESEFGCFVRDEFPDHFEADSNDWDDDDDDEDWDDDDYSEGDDWDDDDDCGGIAYMTIIDLIEIDEDQKSITYEDKEYNLTNAKVIEGYA